MPKGDTVCTLGTLIEELERLQKKQIIMLLGMGETLEWCSNSMLVPKVNGIVHCSWIWPGLPKH